MAARTHMRAARTARGLTQEQLAELAQSSQSTIARVENGISMPHADVALRLASALGITAEDLLVVDESAPESEAA